MAKAAYCVIYTQLQKDMSIEPGTNGNIKNNHTLCGSITWSSKHQSSPLSQCIRGHTKAQSVMAIGLGKLKIVWYCR